MSAFEKLISEFKKFPGVGSRQAERFVYHLLTTGADTRARIAAGITELSDETKECRLCFRFFRNGAGDLCATCANPATDTTRLLVVEKDADADAIIKTGAYTGRFFVLGGIVPILADEPGSLIRARELVNTVSEGARGGLTEIILALSVSQEGENTRQYVSKTLEPIVKKHDIKISALGRGLSTGAELEYADTDTLAHALKNRG